MIEPQRCVLCGCELPAEADITVNICDDCYNAFVAGMAQEEAEVYKRWEREEEWREEMRQDVFGDKPSP